VTLRTELAVVVSDIRRIYRELPERVLAWVRRLHSPVDVGEPGHPRPVCPRCKTDWPCPEIIRLQGDDE
jgi:hypothetical protein